MINTSRKCFPNKDVYNNYLMNIACISRRLFCTRCGLRKPSPSFSTSNRFLYTIFYPKSLIVLHRLNSGGLRRNTYLFLVRSLSKAAKREPAKVRNVRWKDLRDIFSLAYPCRRRIYTGLLFLVIGNAIGLILPRIIFMFIDIDGNCEKEGDVRENKTDEKNMYFILAAKYLRVHYMVLFGLFCIAAASYGIRHYCMHTAGQLVINNLRQAVFRSVIHQDMNFFSKNKVGEIVSRLSTDALIVGQSVSSNLTVGARAFMSFFGSAVIMVYTSRELSEVVTCLTAAIITSGYCFGNLQRKYTLQMQEVVAASNEVATEKFSNIVTVRTLVSELKECETYKKRIHQLWVVSCREGRAAGCMIALHEIAILASLYTIVYYGGQLMNIGTLTYGDLLAFIWYASLCALSLPGMVNFYTELMKGLGASARLFELRNRIPEVPVRGGLLKRSITDGITFKNVSFGYPNRPLLFTDVSFHIPAGKTTAVVGPSGSGKSTIANLILRLFDSNSGHILIDNDDLKSIDPSFWRQQIGTVAQEPILFSTTIRNNIIYGSKHPELIMDVQLEEASDLANALNFIKNLPDGFETVVGEHGTSMLSGGQRQRIAIARALINDPMMLIMDEATSALDATSEDLVRKAILKLIKDSKKTVLIIAHRLSTIKYADQIVVINNGRVEEIGTFDELMLIEDGVFKNLVEKQAKKLYGICVKQKLNPSRSLRSCRQLSEPVLSLHIIDKVVYNANFITSVLKKTFMYII
uniref:BMA-HAF-3 n=1 Tax=Brugia malayi TaxID=6279 RepID=A0A0H5SN86_BRUMA|nr:BMA-HAF-3 [Brugia malayi]